MSEKMTPHDLKIIGENCSGYQSENFGITTSMDTFESEGVSCTTCTNWTGERCVIDAFDNVAVNLGILPEE